MVVNVDCFLTRVAPACHLPLVLSPPSTTIIQTIAKIPERDRRATRCFPSPAVRCHITTQAFIVCPLSTVIHAQPYPGRPISHTSASSHPPRHYWVDRALPSAALHRPTSRDTTLGVLPGPLCPLCVAVHSANRCWCRLLCFNKPPRTDETVVFGQPRRGCSERARVNNVIPLFRFPCLKVFASGDTPMQYRLIHGGIAGPFVPIRKPGSNRLPKHRIRDPSWKYIARPGRAVPVRLFPCSDR